MVVATFSSTHPPLHPTTEEDTINRLRLLRSYRVGIATYRRLLDEYANAAQALEALPKIASDAGVSKYKAADEDAIRREFRAARKVGARLVPETSPNYPVQLFDLSDAPPFLWVCGNIDALTRPMIALVGARNASSLGTRMARRLAKELGEVGFYVVSGLARGVDTAAHLGALDSGTIAVQAGGVDVIYPVENADLAKDITKSGLRLSEAPIGLTPQARHFPARNRLISGLARAVIVVEAAAKSGSLITAKQALDQGREVLAIPGHPFDARASGCNQLIRDGSTLVRNAQDVIEAVGIPQQETPSEQFTKAPPASDLRQADELHSQILSRLGPSPVAEDQLLRDIAAPAAQAAPVLVALEMDGKIIRQPGGLLAKAD